MDESNKISNTKNVQNTKTYACANVNWIQKSFYDSKSLMLFSKGNITRLL